MATTRGKGGSGAEAGATAKTAAKRTRTRAPEDDISGVAAPEAAAPAKRARKAAPGTGVAEQPPAQAPRPARRKAPGSSVAADASATPARPEKPKKRGDTRETYTETAARRRKEKEVDQLAVDLRSFAVARPSGWDHDDWVAFLDHLSTQGHDISDTDGIGRRLEQERLGVVLGGVQGLGPKRVQSLVDRFGSLWSVRHASVDDVAAVPGMTRPQAERLVEELRTRFP
jgi:hypothetical protein